MLGTLFECTLGVLHIKAELVEDCESAAKMNRRVDYRDWKITLLKKFTGCELLTGQWKSNDLEFKIMKKKKRQSPSPQNMTNGWWGIRIPHFGRMQVKQKTQDRAVFLLL